MSKQIFRQNIPSDYLFNLLEQICLKTEHYYVVDYNSYRKLLFYNLDEKLSTDMMEYYHLSKQFYVTRKMTYKSFTNIIRHICKNINVVFTSQMKYNESNYSIVYYIYYKDLVLFSPYPVKANSSSNENLTILP
jgi:hypothetical protein